MLLSLVAGPGALYNPVLISLAVIHVFLSFHQTRLRSWVLLSVGSFALASAVYLATAYLVQGPAFLPFVDSYANHYAFLGHFLQPEYVGTVISNFFVFSILSPLPRLPGDLSWKDLYLFGHPLYNIALLLLIALAVCSAVLNALAKYAKKEPWPMALAIWILALTAFFVYFNPRQASLYPSQILLPLLILMQDALSASSARERTKYAGLLLVTALLGLINAQAFFAGPIRK